MVLVGGVDADGDGEVVDVPGFDEAACGCGGEGKGGGACFVFDVGGPGVEALVGVWGEVEVEGDVVVDGEVEVFAHALDAADEFSGEAFGFEFWCDGGVEEEAGVWCLCFGVVGFFVFGDVEVGVLEGDVVGAKCDGDVVVGEELVGEVGVGYGFEGFGDVFGFGFEAGSEGCVFGCGGLDGEVCGVGGEVDGFNVEFFLEEADEGVQAGLDLWCGDDDGFGEGLASFDLDFAAQGASGFDEGADTGHAVFEVVVDETCIGGGVVAEVDAVWHGGGFEVLVHFFGDEGGEGGEEGGEGEGDVVEGGVGRAFVVGVGFGPESFAAASEVPVAVVVDEEGFDGACGLVGFESGDVLVDVGDDAVESGEDPAVEEFAFFGCGGGLCLVVMVEGGVGGEEAVAVPEGEDEFA